MFHTTRPIIAPRDVRWTHKTPQWYYALTKPPPLIREDFRSIIEHIRLKGRIDDVSLFGNGDMFDVPIYESDEPPQLDKNAPERLEALRRFADEQEARKEYLDWFNSPEQKRKRIAARFKREADREVIEVERVRQQVEYERLQANRAEEQKRRDAEWEQVSRVSQDATKKLDQATWNQHTRLQAIFKGFPATPAIIKKPEKKEWSSPRLLEVSIWWQSGKLIFLDPIWQPNETDWYRVSGKPIFTVRNQAGYIASVPYEAPERESALVPLLKACLWPA